MTAAVYVNQARPGLFESLYSLLPGLTLLLFSLWPIGVLHFHPDNVCSDERDKVSIFPFPYYT